MRARRLVTACAITVGALLALTTTAFAAGTRHPTASVARVGRTSPASPLALVFPLKADLAGLGRLALAVSTPGNPQYHHYESIAQLAARYGAPRASEQRALAFLRRVGATQVKLDATGLFIDATMRAATAERLFATRLTEYRSRQGEYTAPSAAAVLPAALRGLVSGVVGLDTQPVVATSNPFRTARTVRSQLGRLSPAASAFTPLGHAAAAQPTSAYTPVSGTPSGCPAGVATQAFTPNQYLTAYNYTPLQAAGLTGAGERVALIEIDGFNPSDISAFAACFGLHEPPIKSFGVGIKRALAPGGETTLDLEVMTAAAPGLQEIDVYESDANEADALRALTSPLQNKGLKPQVISASLGLCEPFVYNAVGRKALENTEGALEEASAAGISFLDSSGDSGSADCTNSSGNPIDRLAVNYPTSSWWVTGVGGTNIALNAANQLTGQLVWNDSVVQAGSAGGGGKSVLFRRPPYQTGTVAGTRREVPDVSMLADIVPGFAVYCSAAGECINQKNSNPWQSVGGTSAATPLLAGGFAMVDQDLQAHAQQDLGLANPLIYSLGRSPEAASVFSDVTAIGNDVGPLLNKAGRPLGCCTATAGYDDASGWGSVNLTGFAAAALAAPPAIATVSVSVPPQKAISGHGIKATVSCASQCEVGAVASVRIGRGKPFKLYSPLSSLPQGGSKAVVIKFGKKVERRLRAAHAHGDRIKATVVGVVVDIGRRIERASAAAKLRIT